MLFSEQFKGQLLAFCCLPCRHYKIKKYADDLFRSKVTEESV